MADRAQDRIIRICVILRALLGTRRGLTLDALIERAGASRATVYRDLRVLRLSGLALERETVNGEARHRILAESVANLGLGAPQLAAIALAREGLAALEGTEALAALDSLLSNRDAPPAGVRARDHLGPRSPAVVRAIERAIKDRRRLSIDYRSANDDTWTWREVDPGALQLQRGDLYVWAWALEHAEWRTYKTARIRRLETLPTASPVHPGLAEIIDLPHAVRVWSGPPEEVAIRIAAGVAWLVPEHPLVQDQRLEHQADGSVIVRAEVAGLIEVSRWVLGWGAHACVLEPPALRESIRDELTRALAAYSTDDHVVSPIVRHPSATTTPRASPAKRRPTP